MKYLTKRWYFEQLTLAAAESVWLRGVKVHLFVPTSSMQRRFAPNPNVKFVPSKQTLLDRLSLVLDTASQYGPRHYHRLLRNDLKIFVRYNMSPGEYWSAANVCLIDAEALMQRSPEVMASVVIHEAVHAHVHLAGIRWPKDREGRNRIERLCLNEQIDFLCRLPDGARRHERLLNFLRNECDDPAPIPAEYYRSRIQWLQRMGLPTPLLSLTKCMIWLRLRSSQFGRNVSRNV